MQIVIEIPEKTVNEIKDNAMFAGSISSDIRWDITNAIVNGTPLEQEPKTGHWIKYQNKQVCSKCGNARPLGVATYCRGCGAKMKEGD